MHHLFLINPKAGPKDRSEEVARAARTLCEQLGEPCRVRLSEYPGHLTEMAREAGQSGEETRIYACGGDGTLNEVVTGAVGYENLSVTSFPCGSGNDFIKQFAAPELFFALENFGGAETQRVDVIRVNDRYALNICSVGFDARIGTSIDAYRRHPLLSGPRAYHASVVVNLCKGVAKPLRVETAEGLVVDGRMTLVCVCNGSWYGGSYHPVPQADIQDGLLDVLIVKKVSRLTVARVISAYQKGKFEDYPHLITHCRTRYLRLTTPTVEPVNLDGELLSTNSIECELLPGGLKFFAPREAWKQSP